MRKCTPCEAKARMIAMGIMPHTQDISPTLAQFTGSQSAIPAPFMQMGIAGNPMAMQPQDVPPIPPAPLAVPQIGVPEVPAMPEIGAPNLPVMPMMGALEMPGMPMIRAPDMLAMPGMQAPMMAAMPEMDAFIKQPAIPQFGLPSPTMPRFKQL